MQLDVSTTVMRRTLPGRRVVQLAIDDSHPVAVLRDLAGDERFSGVVVAEVSEYGLSRRAWQSQRGHVEYARRQSTLDRRLNSRMAAALEGRLALLNPSVDLFKTVRAGTIPPPWYIVTHEDRSREADYSLSDLPRQRAIREAWIRDRQPPSSPDPEQWLAEALAVDSLAGRITSRGGRVVFVAFPSTGASWEANERVYPKARYWDRFASAASSATVHFRDVESLAGFDCPDTSHLDARDVQSFSAALLEELARHGVLEVVPLAPTRSRNSAIRAPPS
jgi:hypothetical protein